MKKESLTRGELHLTPRRAARILFPTEDFDLIIKRVERSPIRNLLSITLSKFLLSAIFLV